MGLVSGLLLTATVFAAPAGQLPVQPLLTELMTFQPGWVTRSITSHDPTGNNGDGSGNGIPNADGYRVLFREKGEGRILRLWMTVPDENQSADYKELWIEIDGATVYRGPVLAFFEGRSGNTAWTHPLVNTKDQASGAFLSLIPFSYGHEARIRFKGDPHYFQVTYREGPGSSRGPTAGETHAFLTDDWTRQLPERRQALTVPAGETVDWIIS